MDKKYTVAFSKEEKTPLFDDAVTVEANTKDEATQKALQIKPEYKDYYTHTIEYYVWNKNTNYAMTIKPKSFMRLYWRGNCLFDGGRISLAESQMIRPGGMAFTIFQFIRAIANKLAHKWQAFRHQKTTPIIFIMLSRQDGSTHLELSAGEKGTTPLPYPIGCQCVAMIRNFFMCMYTYLPFHHCPFYIHQTN
jgi:hypothetical protein